MMAGTHDLKWIQETLSSMIEQMEYMNRAEVARRLNVSRSAVTSFFDPEIMPRVETLDKIARTMGMRVVVRLTEDNEQGDEPD